MTVQKLARDPRPGSPPTPPASLDALLGAEGNKLIVLATSRDVNAKMSILIVPGDQAQPAIVVKIPTTALAARAVEAEGRLLVALHGESLPSVGRAVPRFVRVYDAAGLPAVAATAVHGTPMRTTYHRWLHTSAKGKVVRDFAVAARWLADFQRESAVQRAPVRLLTDGLAGLARRWPDDPRVADIHQRLAPHAAGLAAAEAPLTAVHGDYWHGNILVRGGAVSGVVDWECGALQGDPTRDVARFPLGYALYLDRHTRAGWPVIGHRGLVAGTWGIGVEYALFGAGWFGELVRSFVGEAMQRLGIPPNLWRAVLLGGIAEVAATADHPDFAERHLDLLWRLAGRVDEPRR